MGHTVTKEEARHLGVLNHTVKIVLVYLLGMHNCVGDVKGQTLARWTADEYFRHQETSNDCVKGCGLEAFPRSAQYLDQHGSLFQVTSSYSLFRAFPFVCDFNLEEQ